MMPSYVSAALLLQTTGCTWSDNYPTAEDFKADLAAGRLFVLHEEDHVIGFAAYGDGAEYEVLYEPEEGMRQIAALCRVGVAPAHQGRGLAKAITVHIMAEAKLAGYDGVILLVGLENPAAQAVYCSFGFVCCGACTTYKIDWKIMRRHL